MALVAEAWARQGQGEEVTLALPPTPGPPCANSRGHGGPWVAGARGPEQALATPLCPLCMYLPQPWCLGPAHTCPGSCRAREHALPACAPDPHSATPR